VDDAVEQNFRSRKQSGPLLTQHGQHVFRQSRLVRCEQAVRGIKACDERARPRRSQAMARKPASAMDLA
jgi:hypothetical protein